MIRSKPQNCLGCVCYAHGTDFSQVEGTGALGVLIVGEASGDNEARDQLPFRSYAQAGSVLQRIFRMAGYDRNQFSITNTLRCRPRGDWLAKSPWEYAAISHCSPNLDAVVAERKPKAIWALGDIAMRTLTGMTGKHRNIMLLQGYVLDSRYGIPLIASLHPSFIARGASEFYFAVSEQLKRVVKVAQQGFIRKPTHYITHPSLDDARSFLYRCQDNPNALITYDIETPTSRDISEDERDSDPSFELDSIQFSIEPQTGIFFPATPEFISIAKLILSLPNRKAGWNNRGYDDPRLQHHGFEINGLVEDFMHKWHHYQPDLPQNLQFASQWLGMDFPWKHRSDSEPQYYGCADVDSLQRADKVLTETLKVWNINESYEIYVRDFYPILQQMSKRGLPIDNAARLAFGDKLDKVKAETDAKIQAHVPDTLKPIHPKEGYKKLPKDLTGLVEREFTVACVIEGQPSTTTVKRYCRVEPFSPSKQQMVAYMKAKGHPVPKKPKETNPDGSPKETSDEKGLERLYAQTGDLLYKWVIEYRGFDKMRSTYVEGFAPDADGRVHTTFTYSPAQWQLSSRNPNCQNMPVHKGLADEFGRIIAASAGYKIIGFDYKSFHPLMLSFESEDADYMRLVRLDVHSYLTAHFMKLAERDKLIGMADDELRDRLQYVKKQHKHVRDYKCKRVVCGWGNGEGYRLCYEQWREYFESMTECKRLFDLLEALFPRATKWKQDICKKASVWPEHGGKPYLISRYGAIRWFWETFKWNGKKGGLVPGADYNKVQAFFPPNDAFGHKRDSMRHCEAAGYNNRYALVNDVHDASYYLAADALTEECIHNVRNVMQQLNPKLRNRLAPDGVWVEVGVKIGQNLTDMEELALARPALPLVGAAVKEEAATYA